MPKKAIPCNSNVRFVCEAKGFNSGNVIDAVMLSIIGRWVDVFYNDIRIGHLIYSGFSKSISDISDDIRCGSVFFNNEKSEYIIIVPD